MAQVAESPPLDRGLPARFPLRFKLLILFSAVQALVENAILVYWVIYPDDPLLVLTPILYLTLTILFGLGIASAVDRWSQIRWRSLIPITITVVGLFCHLSPARWLQREAAAWYLRTNLFEYQAAVQTVVEGKLTPAEQGEPVFSSEQGFVGAFECPSMTPEPCKIVHVYRRSDGETETVFFLASGFLLGQPVLVHSPRQTGPTDSILDDVWSNNVEIEENWYRASD